MPRNRTHGGPVVAGTQVMRQSLLSAGTTLAPFAMDTSAWTVGLLGAAWRIAVNPRGPGRPVPLSTPLGGGAIALMFMLGVVDRIGATTAMFSLATADSQLAREIQRTILIADAPFKIAQPWPSR